MLRVPQSWGHIGSHIGIHMCRRRAGRSAGPGPVRSVDSPPASGRFQTLRPRAAYWNQQQSEEKKGNSSAFSTKYVRRELLLKRVPPSIPHSKRSGKEDPRVGADVPSPHRAELLAYARTKAHDSTCVTPLPAVPMPHPPVAQQVCCHNRRLATPFLRARIPNPQAQ